MFAEKTVIQYRGHHTDVNPKSLIRIPTICTLTSNTDRITTGASQANIICWVKSQDLVTGSIYIFYFRIAVELPMLGDIALSSEALHTNSLCSFALLSPFFCCTLKVSYCDQHFMHQITKLEIESWWLNALKFSGVSLGKKK